LKRDLVNLSDTKVKSELKGGESKERGLMKVF